MKLRELLAGVEILSTNVNMDLQITDVVYDSRKVTKGSLFVAISGFATDGNRFIPMALEKGAVAAVTAKAHTRPSAQMMLSVFASQRLRRPTTFFMRFNLSYAPHL